MQEKYWISGMFCDGCRTKVEKKLSTIKGVISAKVSLPDSAEIEIDDTVSTEILQKELSSIGDYQIEWIDPSNKKVEQVSKSCCSSNPEKHNNEKKSIKKQEGNGVFYCPMLCEGDKTYDKLVDCPICGMPTVEQAKLNKRHQYTCPMHPEVVSDHPGDCPECGMDLVLVEPEIDEEQKSYNKLLKKMKIALLFTLPVFVISMSDMLMNNPLLNLMSHQQWNWMQFIFTLPVVFYAGWVFFVRAWKSIITWNLNMFTLVGIGTGVAFLFSVVGLIYPDFFPNDFKTESGSVMLYFEATVVILTLVLLGQLLEAKAHSKTNGALKELLNLAPSEAVLVTNGEDKLISIHDIEVGNLLRVKPGGKIPVDGKIIEGSSSIDESMISGEPIPVDKSIGDYVNSGTINGNSSFIMEAEKIGSDTLLSQIIQMVNEASHSRAPIQKLADRIAKYFVPTVVIVSLLTFVLWAIYGPEPALVYGFVNAIAVMIIACPCALGLATPMSIMVGVGKGAQSGILIKNAEALENLNRMDVLITDKTGTITEGKPSVENIFTINEANELEVIQFVASLNQQSEHPLAEAIVKYGKSKNVSLLEVKDFENIPGQGVLGKVNSNEIAIGNLKLLEGQQIQVNEELKNKAIKEQSLGKTVSYISVNKQAVAIVIISDAIKKTSKNAIAELQKSGVEVIMMTGDNEKTALAVAKQLNLSHFEAGCLPKDKLDRIKELQAIGKFVVMAGDGINDSPALAQANIGIAMGTGADVAIESAGITLIKGDLNGILKAKKLSHKVMQNIKQNLFFAFIYNLIGIPIAAGILFLFGLNILLSPMIAATAMSFSSVSVIANSLRLRATSL